MRLDLDGPLLLVGVGKMGGALLAGWLARGLDPGRIIAVDPMPSREMKALIEQHRIRLEAALPKLAQPPAVMLMAVKPQTMDAAFPPVAALAGPATVVISIAAGRTIA